VRLRVFLYTASRLIAIRDSLPNTANKKKIALNLIFEYVKIVTVTITVIEVSTQFYLYISDKLVTFVSSTNKVDPAGGGSGCFENMSLV
jgi:hypothetical protein